MASTSRLTGITTTMFTDPFMQRALLAALFLGPLCALLGVFVIARRMAFFSDTVSHSALAVMWLKERTELLTDTILALLLSGSVALGVTLLSLLHGKNGRNYQAEL